MSVLYVMISECPGSIPIVYDLCSWCYHHERTNASVPSKSVCSSSSYDPFERVSLRTELS